MCDVVSNALQQEAADIVEGFPCDHLDEFNLTLAYTSRDKKLGFSQGGSRPPGPSGYGFLWGAAAPGPPHQVGFL